MLVKVVTQEDIKAKYEDGILKTFSYLRKKLKQLRIRSTLLLKAND